MKDLWADLQVSEDDLDADDMGWSLEQLERELAHMEVLQPDIAPPPPQPTPQSIAPPPPGMSAASLVVKHAQERVQQPPSIPLIKQQQMLQPGDAWSQSLEAFTASSLEQDFLAADSARKQKPLPRDMLFMASATDYDVSEPMNLGPPPGMASSTASKYTHPKPPGIIFPYKSKITQREAAVVPPIPQALIQQEREEDIPIPISLQKANLHTPNGSLKVSCDIRPCAVASDMITPGSGMVAPFISLPMHHLQQPPPSHTPVILSPQDPLLKMSSPVFGKLVIPTPQHASVDMHATMPSTQAPGAHTPGGPAWRSPPQLQMHQRIFCQHHPAATPIPATALESSLMKSRDVTYVLHSMLKPILSQGISPDDYHIQLLSRHQQAVAAIGNNKSSSSSEQKYKEGKQIETPQDKSKKWMQERSTLGHVARTDVTRPRALIAASLSVEQQDENQQKRATLWKSRLVTDQAHHAFSNIVDIWKASPPGKVPHSQLQPHMVRLFKYLGVIKEVTDGRNSASYRIDEKALPLLTKLPKGRTLVSRVLEQAVLPPNAVQALLPAILFAVLPSSPSSDNSVVDDRLFRSLAQVLSGLPQMESVNLIASSNAFLEHFKQAFQTTPRMECVHALLRRGSAMALTTQGLAVEWKKIEEQFLTILGSM